MVESAEQIRVGALLSREEIAAHPERAEASITDLVHVRESIVASRDCLRDVIGIEGGGHE